MGGGDDIAVKAHQLQQADGVAGFRRAGLQLVVKQDPGVGDGFLKVRQLVCAAGQGVQLGVVGGDEAERFGTGQRLDRKSVV